MIDVVSVKVLGGYTLRVGFSDGSVGVHDFSSTAARDGEMVRPLKDPKFFARVFVELGQQLGRGCLRRQVGICLERWCVQ